MPRNRSVAVKGIEGNLCAQIPEGLFQRIKAHLERESTRTGREYTQRKFVLELIEEALNEARRLAPEKTSQTIKEAIGSSCEATGPKAETRSFGPGPADFKGN